MRRLATTTTAPLNTAAVAAAPKAHLWRSPIPYLFGGLALTMLLIAGALIVLACSYRKHFHNSSDDEDQKEPAAMPVNLELAMEPKILVIMAGDDMPTYLATPAITTTAAKDADVLLCCSCSAGQRDDQISSP